MTSWQQTLLGLLAVGLLTYVAVLAALVVARPRGIDLQAALRLLPDLVRLVSRIARDRLAPRGVRVRGWLLLAYLVCPIDLVPDVVPVIGWADDVIVALIVVRAMVRRAGPSLLERHWPGGPAGLTLLRQAAGVVPA